jgi:hypothetical protein
MNFEVFFGDIRQLELSLHALFIFLGICWIFRKHVLHLADPLLLYFFMTSFGIALVIDLKITHDIQDRYVQSFFLSTLSLFTGIWITGKFGKEKKLLATRPSAVPLSVLFSFLALGVIVMALNSYFSWLTPPPLFAEDVLQARIQAFADEGMGFFRRVNMTLIPALAAMSLLLLFHPFIRPSKTRTILYVFVFLLAIAINLLNSTKSAIGVFVFSAFSVYAINRYLGSLRNRRSLNLFQQHT